MEDNILLKVEDLHVSFNTYAGEVRAVRGADFQVKKGETLAIVGESGSGKSVTAQSVMRLSLDDNIVYKQGRILFDGKEILKLSKKEMEAIRGKEIGMIMQDPLTALNPTMTVGKQIVEGLVKHQGMDHKTAFTRSVELLETVGIPNPLERATQYPHQFSGGMRQRAGIAIAFACNPKLLIADEPTTALDVTIQAQILELMKQIQKDHGTSIILITHDLGIVADMADRIVIMYAGRIVERGTFRDIFYNPAHPYTWGLLGSVPRIDTENKSELMSIKGTPPDLHLEIKGCPFCARCKYAMDVCTQAPTERFQVGEQHFTNCWLQHPYAPTVENPITGRDAKLHE